MANRNYFENLRTTFNYNMGCIWMKLFYHFLSPAMGLTITWDVFEYALVRAYAHSIGEFNYNMGCIWMKFFAKHREKDSGLTITWDVFE